MTLISLPEFPAHEREALLAVLQRAGIAPQRVCVSRLQPGPGQEGLPVVALVSTPGWWRAYEGSDWIERLEQDLMAVAAP